MLSTRGGLSPPSAATVWSPDPLFPCRVLPRLEPSLPALPASAAHLLAVPGPFLLLATCAGGFLRMSSRTPELCPGLEHRGAPGLPRPLSFRGSCVCCFLAVSLTLQGEAGRAETAASCGRPGSHAASSLLLLFCTARADSAQRFPGSWSAFCLHWHSFQVTNGTDLCIFVSSGVHCHGIDTITGFCGGHSVG